MYDKEEENPGIFKPPGIPPKTLNSCRNINGVMHVAGQGSATADIMFVAIHPYEEEVATQAKTTYGRPVKTKPRYLKGPAGTMLADLCGRCGIKMDDAYYTAVLKWYPDKASRGKIKGEQLAYASPLLYAEIAAVKPKIIICLGKPVFDLFVDFKIALRAVAGGWFRNNKHDCLIYPMDDPYKMVMRPEIYETFFIDVLEVSKMLKQVQGKIVPKLETDYRMIRTAAELREFTKEMLAGGYKIVSLDCEWHGQSHVDALIRSVQLCWVAGKAVYIRFMDSELNYVFDVPYKEAGDILKPWLDDPKVKYVGHHASADLPVIHHTLGLEWYNKAFFDTEFAQQVADEDADLKLERLALAYTDLGRYDLELTLWKKQNPKLLVEEDGTSGYGRVPEEILFGYACKDVDTVMRAWPILLADLRRQGLIDYYFKIFNPFVTNVFTLFALFGLPINQTSLDELREVYNYCRVKLEMKFRKLMLEEAKELLKRRCVDADARLGLQTFEAIENAARTGDAKEILELVKGLFGAGGIKELTPLTDHLINARNFNIRSTAHMRKWLFEVKGYTPIKTTNQKANGMPSIPWEKVESMTKAKQSEYKPATDKQTLKILAQTHKDAMLASLLRLNAVGNICKAFLKEGEESPDGTQIVEKGLHAWIASDGRVHGMFSTTETGYLIPSITQNVRQPLPECANR